MLTVNTNHESMCYNINHINHITRVIKHKHVFEQFVVKDEMYLNMYFSKKCVCQNLGLSLNAVGVSPNRSVAGAQRRPKLKCAPRDGNSPPLDNSQVVGKFSSLQNLTQVEICAKMGSFERGGVRHLIDLV